MRLVATMCTALVLVCAASSQIQVQEQRQVQRQGPADTNDNKPKPLTKQQQLQVKQLLESAEAGAAGLDSASRVFVYAELARAYSRTDKKKAVELLQTGLSATRDMQLESADKNLNDQLKRQLQQRIVRDFAELAPEQLDAQMEQLSADVRQIALSALMSYYTSKGHLDRATEIVMSVAQESEMPYGTATELMSALGHQRQDEVRSLFVSSLASYQNHEHRGFQIGGDFPDMILKVEAQIPPAVVQQAIDEVLSQAKKNDEHAGNMSISMASSKGAAKFTSSYDFRLFQLMPILQKLDPARAEKLLQDHQDVNTLFGKYPQGQNSLQSNDQNGGGMSMMIGIGDRSSGPAPPMEGPSVLEQQRVAQVIADAKQHPQDAMANAALLGPEAAVTAYLGIAQQNQKDNPSVAGAALGKASALIEKIPLQQQMLSAQRIADLYIRMNETDKAKGALEQAVNVANRLYKRDIDADDPNLAPKAFWASTNGYRNVIANAQKIDPAWTTSLTKEVQDEGIRVFTQLAMANAISKSSSSGTQIISWFKNGQRTMTFDDDGN